MLGRLVSEDERDLEHLITLPKKLPNIDYKYWWSKYWYNQGNTSQCVAYSWSHWLMDGPVTHKGLVPDMASIYAEAQKIDEWEGENYDGTSVRAGAKILQGLGYIGEYQWAFDLNTLIDTVLSKSPVVVGTNWYSKMFNPEKGIITIGGNMEGGHAYLVNGVHKKKALLRIKNSWGREWGKNGYAWIPFEDMERLIIEDGEICLAKEIKKIGNQP